MKESITVKLIYVALIGLSLVFLASCKSSKTVQCDAYKDYNSHTIKK